MATPELLLPDLNRDRRNDLTAALRAASEPQMSAALIKQLPSRLSPAVAEACLEELVQEGVVFRYPPKTARGKPRYWDRDLASLASSGVSELSTSFDPPVTAKEVLKRLTGPIKFSPAEVTAALDAAVTAGTLHAIPPATAKSPPRYARFDLQEYGRRLVLQLLESKGPQTEAAALKALKGFSPDQAQQLLAGLQERSQLWRHPVCGKIRKELWGVHPPSPAAYLKELEAPLGRVVATLTEAGVPLPELRRSLVELIEAAGVPFTATGLTQPAEVLPAHRTQVDLVELMKQIEPRAARGALVGAADLRRAAGLSKADFDSLVLDLARKQKFALHRHDYPASLSEQAREELVFDGADTYFVGIALRT